jgi:hypothetical protein
VVRHTRQMASIRKVVNLGSSNALQGNASVVFGRGSSLIGQEPTVGALESLPLIRHSQTAVS